MTRKNYFNNYNNINEQKLMEDLVVESIAIYGVECYYLPRTLVKFDQLYTTDDQSAYNAAYLTDLYVSSVDGFGPTGNIMAKFGLEIREQIMFSIAYRTFNTDVGRYTHQPRPNEGDIIWFPLNNKPLQIKFVDNKEFFYQFGALQFYDLTCELFEYSDEVFNTGIPMIDSMQQQLSTNILDYAILDPQGNYLQDPQCAYILDTEFDLQKIDSTSNSDEIDSEANTIIDWSAANTNPFGELNDLNVR